MIQQVLNWRLWLAALAIAIVSGTIWYSSYVAGKIEKEEKEKVEAWIEASTALLNPNNTDARLPFKIIQDNDDIPIIATDEKGAVIGYRNIDSAKAATDTGYLKTLVRRFAQQNKPIQYTDPYNATGRNFYYYGHSRLLQEVRYYPLVQLCIVGLFIAITIFSLRSSYLSTQNGVWAGMAKETAHQLGTPVSSLEGWVELLKETHPHEAFLPEIEKDVSRLRLVSDRFGKIGSKPQLTPVNLVNQIAGVMDYVRKRASGKVQFSLNAGGAQNLSLALSPPLFDWVIENLLKNALDAMEGSGQISINVQDRGGQVVIDVTDTGKGIAAQHVAKVFKPGFSTKKRGWGLGLSLSKRIIEQYHGGTIGVKNSELGKGTTFRIVLKK